METLKFLMITTHYPPMSLGGDAVFVQNLAEELARRGHEVQVLHKPSVYGVLRGKGTPSASGRNTRMSVTGLDSRFPRVELLDALMLGRAASRKDIIEAHGRMKPDVVHWHNVKGLVGTPFSLPGSRTLWTMHDYYAICPRSNLLRPDMSICMEARYCTFCNMRWRKPPAVWRVRGRRVLRPRDDVAVISPSKYLADRVGREGIPVKSVLPNFVPDPGAATTTSPEPDSLVYLGIVERHKGVLTLLEAFDKSKDRHQFKLYFIGEGSLREHLLSEVERRRLGDRVKVTGYLPRDEVEKIRGGSAAQIVPSEWPENAPLTVIEAFAQGVPVIASDAGGLPEMIEVGDSGRVYPVGNAGRLGEILAEAWTGRDKITKARALARKSYEERFTPERHVQRYLGLIESLGA